MGGLWRVHVGAEDVFVPPDQHAVVHRQRHRHRPHQHEAAAAPQRLQYREGPRRGAGLTDQVQAHVHDADRGSVDVGISGHRHRPDPRQLSEGIQNRPVPPGGHDLGSPHRQGHQDPGLPEGPRRAMHHHSLPRPQPALQQTAGRDQAAGQCRDPDRITSAR